MPLARALRAGLPRLGAARRSRPARRGVRRGRPLVCRAPRRGGRPGRRALPERGRAPRRSLLVPRRPAARDRPYPVRSGRDDPLPAGLERQHEGDRDPPRDGVVRPLLCAWREETEAYCRENGLEWREDSSNAATVRGLIRREVLPLLERIHPAARENVLRVLDERRTMPPALAELLDAPVGSKRVDLGGGVQAVREHDRLWLERGTGLRSSGEVDVGPVADRIAAAGAARARVASG